MYQVWLNHGLAIMDHIKIAHRLNKGEATGLRNNLQQKYEMKYIFRRLEVFDNKKPLDRVEFYVRKFREPSYRVWRVDRDGSESLLGVVLSKKALKDFLTSRAKYIINVMKQKIRVDISDDTVDRRETRKDWKPEDCTNLLNELTDIDEVSYEMGHSDDDVEHGEDACDMYYEEANDFAKLVLDELGVE